ncbi:MAG: MotA/TolQ/ExbB proton channel family protein [candidate division Zixibacteria bacterium]
MRGYLIYFSTLLVPDPGKGSLWDDIIGMTAFSKGIMIILLFMSVVSWTIMIWNYFKTRKIHFQTDRFLRKFRGRKSLEDFQEAAFKGTTPFYGLLSSAYDEIRGLAERRKFSSNPTSRARIDDSELDMVEDAIDRAGADEIVKQDKGILFLATTANAAPFLGLLGTVIGIYSAFKDIGARGTATLGVVAPAIAEALIATAAGLAVAIPALVGYNYFVSRNRLMADRIENFKSELFAAFKKELEIVEEA